MSLMYIYFLVSFHMIIITQQISLMICARDKCGWEDCVAAETWKYFCYNNNNHKKNKQSLFQPTTQLNFLLFIGVVVVVTVSEMVRKCNLQLCTIVFHSNETRQEYGTSNSTHVCALPPQCVMWRDLNYDLIEFCFIA